MDHQLIIITIIQSFVTLIYMPQRCINYVFLLHYEVFPKSLCKLFFKHKRLNENQMFHKM